MLVATCGRPPHSSEPVGPDVRRAREVGRRRHQRRPRALGRGVGGDQLDRAVEDRRDAAAGPAVLPVGGQVRRREARVRGERLHRQLRAPEPAVELVGEEQVGELGLAVRRPAAGSARSAPAGRPAAPSGRSGASARRPRRRGRPPDATSWGSRSPVSRNGPKWLVAICSSSPSAVRWYGVPMTPGVVDQHVDRSEHRRRSPRPGVRTPGRRGRARPSRASRVGTSSRIACAVSARRSGERPVSTTRAPRRASSSAVWWPRPPTVVPVTRMVRPAWSGMSPGSQRAGRVTAWWPSRR